MTTIADDNTPYKRFVDTAAASVPSAVTGGYNLFVDGGLPKVKNSGGTVTVFSTKYVQVVETQSGAVSTGTTTIPLDDSIPVNTEGTEWITLAITPTNASNYLYFDTNIMVAPSTTAFVIGALFQDTTANALAVGYTYLTTANSGSPLRIFHKMVAGTTSATTFKIRVGPQVAATVTINGQVGGRLFGGVSISSFTITEIAV